jgi:hypothetical protein
MTCFMAPQHGYCSGFIPWSSTLCQSSQPGCGQEHFLLNRSARRCTLGVAASDHLNSERNRMVFSAPGG